MSHPSGRLSVVARVLLLQFSQLLPLLDSWWREHGTTVAHSRRGRVLWSALRDGRG